MKQKLKERSIADRISDNTGTSMLELGLVLVLIAIVISSLMFAGTGQIELSRRLQTAKKMDVIEKALAAFVALNGRLPCPGDASQIYTSTAAGSENCAGTLSVNIGALIPTLPFYTINNGYPNISNHVPVGDQPLIIGGSVPTTALQLPNEFMLDGWGNKITYAVSKATAGGANNNYSLQFVNEGIIEITDFGAPSTNNIRTKGAVYVLLSGGLDGLGTWPKGAGNIQQNSTMTANPGEQQNSWSVWEGGAPYGLGVFNAQLPTVGYGDITRYKMKWQIIREAGAVISESTCTEAKNLLAAGASTNISPTTFATDYCNSNNLNMDPNCPVYLGMLAKKMNDLCLNQ